MNAEVRGEPLARPPWPASYRRGRRHHHKPLPVLYRRRAVGIRDRRLDISRSVSRPSGWPRRLARRGPHEQPNTQDCVLGRLAKTFYSCGARWRSRGAARSPPRSRKPGIPEDVLTSMPHQVRVCSFVASKIHCSEQGVASDSSCSLRPAGGLAPVPYGVRNRQERDVHEHARFERIAASGRAYRMPVTITSLLRSAPATDGAHSTTTDAFAYPASRATARPLRRRRDPARRSSRKNPSKTIPWGYGGILPKLHDYSGDDRHRGKGISTPHALTTTAANHIGLQASLARTNLKSHPPARSAQIRVLQAKTLSDADRVAMAAWISSPRTRKTGRLYYRAPLVAMKYQRHTTHRQFQ